MKNEPNSRKKAAIFVMPRSSRAWRGSEALWITVAGWASAAERVLGQSWVITSDTIAKPEEVFHYPLGEQHVLTKRNKSLPFIPLSIKTLIKDLLLWKNRNNRNYADAAWNSHDVQFVWEQHDLFAGPGRKLATRLKVPLIVYVHAPVVWEAKKWGVKRPGWGFLLEYFFERKSLLAADLVACLSSQVAEKIIRMGIDRRRIIISPMSVDVHRFNLNGDNEALRDKLGVRERLVIGWIGSFRSFHGLDKLISAFAKVHKAKRSVALLLVGDGPERSTVVSLAKELHLENDIILPGRIPYAEIPKYVQLFNISVVSAARAEDFHYSPLKLREYLGAKKATIAPRAGEIPQVFKDKEELLLYDTNVEGDLTDKILMLVSDPGLRTALAERGYFKVANTGTWDYELLKSMEKLNFKND